MKKLSHNTYKTLFVKHVYSFLQSVTHSRELQDSVLVSVSGGRDSMTLLWLAHQLHLQNLIGDIRAVFVHHQTRSGQDSEAKLVEEFCVLHQIPFKILKAQGLRSSEGNFEHRARLARKSLLEAELRDNEWLWQGHHLDDSYEWSFMQRHRGSNPRANLGIPVRNGKIIRPFLCVGRKQITRLSHYEHIPFANDPTNLDLNFDRNYLRHSIIPALYKRYPKFLKHYALASNQLASILNLHCINKIDNNMTFKYMDGAIIEGESFSQQQTQELIKNYSNAQRGKISYENLRMLRAIKNAKKGPFQFSGGVEAYFTPQLLMIYPKSFRNDDQLISEQLGHLSLEQLRLLPGLTWEELVDKWEELKQSPTAMRSMPGLLLILETDSKVKTLNGSVYDARYPKVSKVIADRGMHLTTCPKCIKIWSMKKQKLPKTLRLVPLWHLPHLFPSH